MGQPSTLAQNVQCVTARFWWPFVVTFVRKNVPKTRRCGCVCMHVQRERKSVRLNCGATNTNIRVGRHLVLRLQARHAEYLRTLENSPKQNQANRDVQMHVYRERERRIAKLRHDKGNMCGGCGATPSYIPCRTFKNIAEHS